jgi:hypothetical protein
MRAGRLRTLALGAALTSPLLPSGCSYPRMEMGGLGSAPLNSLPPLPEAVEQAPKSKSIDPAVTPAGVQGAESPKSAGASPPSPLPAGAGLRSRPAAVAEIMPTGATTAARVGDEVITQAELDRAIRVWKRANVPEGQTIPPELIPQIEQMNLNSLVERTLIIQEAHRRIKDAKKWETLAGLANQKWLDDELEPLLRKYKVKTLRELELALDERGDSLAEIRATFRDETITREFIRMQLGPRLRINLPEMRSYYAKYRNNPKYHREAKVTWREIAVDTSKAKTSEAAKRQAEALFARLQRGEDFAALAKSQSHGVTAKDGGLWETGLGGFKSKALNDAIERQPIGSPGRIIEDSDGFHIVRIESRVPAGTLSFGEVQDQIRDTLFKEKLQRETTTFLGDLRARTPVVTRFDDKKTDEAVKAASGRAP